MKLPLPVQSEDLPFRSPPSTISRSLSKEGAFDRFLHRDVCLRLSAFRNLRLLTRFQSENLPLTSRRWSRFRSVPKNFPSAAGIPRFPSLSRRRELSIVSYPRNAHDSSSRFHAFPTEAGNESPHESKTRKLPNSPSSSVDSA